MCYSGCWVLGGKEKQQIWPQNGSLHAGDVFCLCFVSLDFGLPPFGTDSTFGFGLLAPPQLQTRDQSDAPEHTEDCGEPLLPAAKRARTQSSFPKREVEVDGLTPAGGAEREDRQGNTSLKNASKGGGKFARCGKRWESCRGRRDWRWRCFKSL